MKVFLVTDVKFFYNICPRHRSRSRSSQRRRSKHRSRSSRRRSRHRTRSSRNSFSGERFKGNNFKLFCI